MANAPVNIVYPIDGSTYPVTNPGSGTLKSAYLAYSFGCTRGGGPTTVTWGFDRTTVGEARFYDQFSAQGVWKVAGGTRRFWVKTNKGDSDAVKFSVGS